MHDGIEGEDILCILPFFFLESGLREGDFGSSFSLFPFLVLSCVDYILASRIVTCYSFILFWAELWEYGML